ncbi:hypothetical protein ACFL3R_00705 [Thermodesulfobacteriota bacterium]
MKDEQYIKQCDCPEIQDAWEPRVGDWTDKGMVCHIADNNLNNIIIRTRASESLYGRAIYQKKDLTWLPTQEQLQGMLGYPLGGLVTTFCEWLDDVTFPVGEIRTMNQLWLAFVMHELHGKKWDGKEWV